MGRGDGKRVLKLDCDMSWWRNQWFEHHIGAFKMVSSARIHIKRNRLPRGAEVCVALQGCQLCKDSDTYFSTWES